jgi:hypothetical protein
MSIIIVAADKQAQDVCVHKNTMQNNKINRMHAVGHYYIEAVWQAGASTA